MSGEEGGLRGHAVDYHGVRFAIRVVIAAYPGEAVHEHIDFPGHARNALLPAGGILQHWPHAARMRLVLLLIAAAMAAGAAEPERPSSCPSLDHASWSWSALYADDASHVIVISVEKGAGDSPATFLDLQPGAKPLRRAVALSSTGMVKEGGHEIAVVTAPSITSPTSDISLG
jgi:hypothetical protein